MTDKEKLCALLDSWGVKYTTETDTEAKEINIEVKGCRDESWQSEKVTGYLGFMTIYTFNLDGSFKEMGAWE